MDIDRTILLSKRSFASKRNEHFPLLQATSENHQLKHDPTMTRLPDAQSTIVHSRHGNEGSLFEYDECLDIIDD